MSLFAEFKRRNVFRMGALYVVASWVVLQVAELLFDALAVPEWGVRLVIGLLILGFPLVLIFSWVYELTPEGLKRETDVDRSRSITHHTGRKINVLIAALLAAAIGLVLYDRFNPRVVPSTAGTEVSTAGPEESLSSAPEDSPTAAPVNPLTTGAGVAAAKFAPGRSVAVLPFVNMSADTENEYFSDGLSEELLNLLARIPELRVAARTSSFSFKGKDVDIPTVGQQLNVAHVLEGSVRKSGDRVRITAQLVKAADGYHLWSDTYNRRLDDIFAIQDEIAKAVVAELKLTLLGVEPVKTEVRTTDPRAYEAVLLGRHYRNHGTETGFERALAEYDRAIAIDPTYAPAWAGKSLTVRSMTGFGFRPYEEGFKEARLAAEHAIALDPELAVAYRALGKVLAGTLDLVESQTALRRAVELGPGDAENIAAWADALSTAGRYDEARFELKRAVELNPLDNSVLGPLAWDYLRSNELDEAEQTLARLRELEPNSFRLPAFASWIAMRRGNFEAMLTLTDQIPEGYEFLKLMNRAIAYRGLGDEARAQASLDELIRVNSHNAPFQIAIVYADWGDADKMFEWLDRAVEIGDPGMLDLNKSWAWDGYKDDPRWDAVLEKSGLKAVMEER